MQIEYAFLRSRVARRVFFLFILCALLPVGALSVVSLTDVTRQLTQQAERRVQQESKAMGMAIYQRLLLLEAGLQVISSQAQTIPVHHVGGVMSPSRLSNTPGFTGVARLSEDGVAELVLGEMRSIPSLSEPQWALLRQQKTLMMNIDDAGVRRLLFARLLDFTNQAVLAEIDPSYLWDLSRSLAPPKDMFFCVFGKPTVMLFCSQPLPEELREQWARRGAHGRPSLFEWREGEDSYISGSWEMLLRSDFSTDPWTVVLSESQHAMLELLGSFRSRFILVVVIALSCAALLSVIQIRKFMVPLEQLGEGTRRVAARNFSQPVRIESGDEFEQLAVSFNSMAGRLHQQFAQLATIHEIDRSVLSVLDPSRIVDTVLARLREVSPCEGVAVLLMDSAGPTQGWLYARTAANNNQTAMTGVSVGEAERAMLISHEGGTTLMEAEGAGAFTELCGSNIVSLMVLPLFRSRDLLGAIAMSYRSTPEMDAEERERLRQLADQVAVALSNASDLAERKRAETSLRENHAKLEQALTDLQTAQQQMVQQERLRALGQMASGIAHDFNNTLSPIMGFSELLLIAPQMSADPAQLKEYLQTINMAAKDAAKVVSRLREFYRPRLDADLAGIVDLNRLVEQSVKLSQPKWKDQALANGVAIEIKTELDSVPPVAGHESELREVLTNLVFNAVDAMPKSGSITLRTKADGEYVRLEVADTGTGMTEDVRQRCLEPFFSTKGEKGSGLGLAMVYGIIKRLRGTIDITSAVGMGTTFSIRLPIQAEQDAGSKQDGHSLDGVHLQILVVDDDPLVGRVTGEYLRVAGHQVEVVTSAADAIKRFNPERVHLVVTDHGMPHMTGRQLAEVIKQVSPETPVVLLTGGDEIDEKETASSAVDAELCKPLTMAALQHTLSTLTFSGVRHAESRKEIGDAA